MSVMADHRIDDEANLDILFIQKTQHAQVIPIGDLTQY